MELLEPYPCLVFKISLVVTLTKKQESILKAIDKKLLDAEN